MRRAMTVLKVWDCVHNCTQQAKKSLVLGAVCIGVLGMSSLVPTLAQASALADQIVQEKGLTGERAQAVHHALDAATYATQGVEASHHPETAAQCEQTLNQLKGGDSDIATCGSPWMVRVPGTAVCIDRFEYPNVPCQYPVTWVQASQAANICQAEGKRLCDASEWEGACADAPQPKEWTQTRAQHNAQRKLVWATGDHRDPSLCAMGSGKSAACQAAIEANKGVHEACGQNTWPAGSFPKCGGELGVYDQMGNAAEHMNLPLAPDQAGSAGGHGVTEMKGAWFAFSNLLSAKVVHPDDCEWREPGWHRTKVMDPRSHSNYHLGFRCCKDIGG